MKIGILYVGIGKYIRLWDKFYSSCESMFLPQYEKKYFIFTDYPLKNVTNVQVSFQEDLGWPKNVLFRYQMFLRHKEELKHFDYLFFFNGNTEFLQIITPEEFLPTEKEALTGLGWHTYRNKPLRKYHYERRKNSQAYIPYNSGEHYYQGGLIGGESKAYIELLEQCSLMTETDLKRNITARWHDESYLNKYLLDKQIKILSTEYGRPQEWTVPPTPKIIFRDKNTILGASYICSLKKRNRLKLISKAIRNILNKLLKR